MPYEIVRQGMLYVRPHVATSAPPPATKMPFVMSPSMPSQFWSVNVASGESVIDGGWHVPQPLAPPHVCAPTHTFHGVMMLHGCIAPGFAAVQSHALLVAMH